MIHCNQVCMYNFPDDGCLKPKDAVCPLFNVARDTNVLTNADHIRSMTDEELAEFMFLMLDCVSCQNKLMRGKCTEEYFAVCKGNGKKCKEICLHWLKQPFGEGDEKGK